jgi:hypothetical protein
MFVTGTFYSFDCEMTGLFTGVVYAPVVAVHTFPADVLLVPKEFPQLQKFCGVLHKVFPVPSATSHVSSLLPVKQSCLANVGWRMFNSGSPS